MESCHSIEITPEFARALETMEGGDRHCLITGKAGTGKSTLLRHFRETTRRKVVVLAPTGVAAVNVSGQTIHSFFKFRPGITPDKAEKAGAKAKKSDAGRVYREIDVIIMDEISMVRADLFDCADRFMRRARGKTREPFGGVKVIMIGDLYQLPPVVTSAEREVFKTLYPGPYFFDAPGFADMRPEFVELERVFRQKDGTFVRLLNAVRNNTITDADLALLNRRHVPNAQAKSGTVTLTATNAQADDINTRHLNALPGKSAIFTAAISGSMKRDMFPTEVELALKPGAQVMMLSNDAAGRWVNGTMAQVLEVDAKEEQIVVRTEDGVTHDVLPHSWEMMEYAFDAAKGRLLTEKVGRFTQIPVRLAWALTVHKSQGKTFDRMVVDVGRGMFATGQMYVALSRCRTLEGIALRQIVTRQQVRTDWRIIKFLTQYQYSVAEEALSLPAKLDMIQKAIAARQDLAIVYLKSGDVKSRRTIRPQTVGDMEYAGYTFVGVSGLCTVRGEPRTFNVAKILEMKVVGESE